MSWASIVILGILSHILVINSSRKVSAKHMISFLALLIIIGLAAVDILIKHYRGDL
ncbi:hypothetical protein D3C81_2177690 [compost metagenome]